MGYYRFSRTRPAARAGCRFGAGPPLGGSPACNAAFVRLCEDLASGRSSLEKPGLLRSLLPELLGVTSVQVHLLDRASGTLRPLADGASMQAGGAGYPNRRASRLPRKTVELCFRNRSLISVPDTHRSPFFDHQPATPRSMTCVPMFAGDDLLGVLEISDARRVRRLSEGEQAAVRHLGNQIAIGIRLIEQKSIREQALGGDRLQTACDLAATAAEGMYEPLAAIGSASRALIARHPEGPDRAEFAAISTQAGRAEAVLSRLLWLIGLHREQVHLVDLSALVRNLMELRQEEWKQRGIRVLDVLPPEPLFVPAVPGTLERVLLSLFWYVEDRLAESSDKTIRLRVFRLAARAQVDIGWVGPALESEGADPLDNPRSPIRGRLQPGGLPRSGAHQCGRDEAGHGSRQELALRSRIGCGPARLLGRSRYPSRQRTGSPRSHGVDCGAGSLCPAVPYLAAQRVGSPQPFRSPVWRTPRTLSSACIFTSFSVQLLTWVRGGSIASRRAADRVDAFVLLTEGHDPALSAALPAGEAYTLPKPISADELERLVQAVEARVTGLKQ